ncbi:hypothetical protein F5Y13DRAFT_164937 [Hypoxylon sp. FL1857]|nr:hypothetical protein F5Y13DRAFT_164937 [Hypoxylon sp. FL1857]
MPASSDNDMTRFLFAILRQKNLKDIDWNQVAHDPILGEGKKITNGHAARMRYSRFRSALLGLEPTRRNRTRDPKCRVTKLRKGSKGKKDENVKAESTPDPPGPQESFEAPPPRIKQESSQYNYNRFALRLTPDSGPMPCGPTMPNTPNVIQPRLLTPCSDDMFSPNATLASSPVSDMLNSQNSSFEFRGSPCPDHTDPMWPSVPSYPTFAPNYSFDDYGARPCDHPHPHVHPSQVHLGLPTQPNESEADFVDVKHEPWDEYN